ncbi:carboxypeptidase M32, partial [Vibrio splendidus]
QGNFTNGCMQDIHWTDGERTLNTNLSSSSKSDKRLIKHNYRDGCMQDIHWCDGSFGYFPSYTLGAMYAAQFMASMKQTVNVDEAIRSGDMTPIFTWLSENIWSKGS